ncbi:MAG: glutamate racemase [Anaerolineales bacterium]|nr:glutamate racemase [Anaerolineales bacterium]
MTTSQLSLASIGVFDSGVGGLSVLRELQAQYPQENILYLADQAHVPYGSRPLDQVRAFSEGITRYFVEKEADIAVGRRAKLVVVACNTASAAALRYLRRVFPQVHFVGMEPAVKPAAEHTNTRVVGVLATPATFQGALYASVVERFANGVTVLQDTCPGLVAQIEKGDLDGDETEAILVRALAPMLAQGIDTVVLGCTHYPFVIPLIKKIVGPGVRVIDPAPAVACQVGRLLDAHGLRRSSGEGLVQSRSIRYLTSGDPASLESLLPGFVGEQKEGQQLRWVDDRLEERRD